MGIMPITKNRNLSTKQKKIVAGHIAGKKNKDLALEVYPDSNPKTAQENISRELAKPEIQDAISQALYDNGITYDKAVKPIADALTATDKHGDPAHAIRLSAASKALELLGLNTSDGSRGKAINILNNTNEIELQRLLFKR